MVRSRICLRKTLPVTMAPLNIVTLVAGLAVLSSAKELVVDMKLKAKLYDPGLVHARIMATKEVSYE